MTGHQVTIENFNIVGREDQNLSRAIKEALYIRVNNPSLNKNIGKFHLPHIWDEVQHLRTKIEIRPWAITSATLTGHPAVAFPSATGNNISLHLLQMVQTMCGLTSSTKLAITSANIWQ